MNAKAKHKLNIEDKIMIQVIPNILQTTSSDGVQISYRDLGQEKQEPALLFIHAWCQSHEPYSQFLMQLAAHRRVLAFDWRGHGQSESPSSDFEASDVIEDALAVIAASGAQQVVPVTIAHGGWIAIELRRRLGKRVAKIIHIDWLVLPPPQAFHDLVENIQSPNQWQQGRDQLFKIWLEGVDNSEVIDFIHNEMASYDAQMWMRAGREIGAGYAKEGHPLQALSTLKPTVPVLHLYAQPDDPGYLAAQKSFAESHSWFRVHKLSAHSHFPTFELPKEIASDVENFITENLKT